MLHFNHISGGNHTACYDVYKAVAKDNYSMGYQIFAAIFNPFGGYFYNMGLRDAVKSICGASFEATEAEYCFKHPSSCMNPEEKKST